MELSGIKFSKQKTVFVPFWYSLHESTQFLPTKEVGSQNTKKLQSNLPPFVDSLMCQLPSPALDLIPDHNWFLSGRVAGIQKSSASQTDLCIES